MSLADGRYYMFALHVAAADVVQIAIIGFANNRIDGEDVLIAGLSKRVFDGAGDAFGDAQRVGENDGRFQVAQLFHLRAAGEFAEGIGREYRRGNLLLE